MIQNRKLQDSKKPDMGNDLKQLMQYIKDHPIQFGDSFDSPSLAGLYWLYSESHKMSDTRSKAAAQNLYEQLCDMSVEDVDTIFALANTLNAEHERIAFQTGVRLGVQLVMELMGEQIR